MKIKRKWSIYLAWPVFGMYLLNAAGIRFNVSPSLPIGLYRLIDKRPAVGDIVSFAIPSDDAIFAIACKRGYFGASRSIIKTVVAMAGDVVTITNKGICVNNTPIPDTRPMSQDKSGRPLAPYVMLNRRLPEEEILLISNHIPESYDARYFGPQSAKHINGVLVPVLIFNHD